MGGKEILFTRVLDLDLGIMNFKYLQKSAPYMCVLYGLKWGHFVAFTHFTIVFGNCRLFMNTLKKTQKKALPIPLIANVIPQIVYQDALRLVNQTCRAKHATLKSVAWSFASSIADERSKHSHSIYALMHSQDRENCNWKMLLIHDLPNVILEMWL